MRFLIDAIIGLAVAAFATGRITSTYQTGAAVTLVGGDRFVCIVNPQGTTSGRVVLDETLNAPWVGFTGSMNVSGVLR